MKIKHLLLAMVATIGIATPSQASEEIPIKCASFNIRMDNPNDSLNSWPYRKDRASAYISDNHIDIIGMQEVLHHQLNDFRERLPEYDYVGIAREDGKTQGEYAPIFYRKDRFEVLDSNTFWLSQYPDSVGFIGWDGACTRIATWAKLKEKKSGKIFMAVNTHFDHVGVLARKNAALLIIEKIKEIAGDHPAFLTGDFNVTKKSEAYRTITTNEFVLKDSRKVAEKRTGCPYTFHNFGRIPQKKCTTIDFIFVTPQIEVEEYKVDEEKRDGSGYLSDHNPVLINMKF